MNYGRFFVLDGESSIPNGVLIFSYTELEDNQVQKKETPRYPIYVVITKEAIEFKLHYYSETPKKIKKHHHSTIFSLPLSENLEVKDGLTTALLEGYDTIFPQYDMNGCNYLCDLVDKCEKDKTKEVKNKDRISYSSLHVFQDKEERNINKKAEERIQITWLIRKLVLDFLFDLEHTRIFQNSPYHEYMSIRLKENFFFNALANKSMYYYYRKIIDQESSSSKVKLIFLYEQFFKIEETWINSIEDSRADHFFTRTKSWFSDPEEEMANIYKKYPKEKEHSEEEYSKKKQLINRISLLQDIQDNKIISNEDKAILEKWDEDYSDIKSKTIRSSKKDSKWQLQKFNFIQAFLCRPLAWIIIFFLILFFVKSIFDTFINRETPFFDYLHKFAHSLYGYITPIICIILAYSIYRNYFKYYYKCSLISISIFISGSILLTVTLFSVFYYINLKYFPFTAWGFLFSLIIALWVLNVTKLKHTQWVNSYFSFGTHLFLPRLFAAIFAAWITISFSEDLFRAFFDSNIYIFVSLGLLIAIFLFVSNEIGRTVPYIQGKQRLRRTVALLLIAFFYSYSIGFVVTGITGEKYLERSGFIREFYENEFEKRNYKVKDGAMVFVIESFHNDFINNFDPTFSDSLKDISVRISNDTNYVGLVNGLTNHEIKFDSIHFSDSPERKVFSALTLQLINQLDIMSRYTHSWKSNHQVLKHNMADSLKLLSEKYRSIDSNLLLTNEENKQDILQKFLAIANNDVLYKRSLKYVLINKSQPILKEVKFFNQSFFILPNFLLQFTFIVMFIGIFIQLIFEQKRITESD